MLLHELKNPPGTRERLIEQCKRTGRPLPDYLENPPTTLPGLDLYLVAFSDLSTCRPVGMGEGPIPWTAVQKYAEVHGYDEEQSRLLHKYVRALDTAYLDWRASTK